MKKITTIVIAVFLIIMVGSVEFGLRKIIEPSQIFGVWYWPEFNEKQFKWSYLLKYKDKPPGDVGFDPDLGWDNPDVVRSRRQKSPNRKSDALRVLFLGDSFTYGNEVGDHETFAYLVGRLLRNAETLNMGVPGYGIDQAVMKLEKKGLAENPNLIVFGIHPPDVQRAVLSFFSARKPRFVFDRHTDKLVLTDHPVPRPLVALRQVREELRFDSFILGLIQNVASTRIPWVRDHMIQATLIDMTRLVEAILLRAKRMAERKEARLVVVQIPHGRSFRDEETRAQLETQYPIPELLVSAYKKLKIPFVDLDSVFLERMSLNDVYRNLYMHAPDGSARHLSVLGNRVAAEAIVEGICKDPIFASHCRPVP